MLQILHKLDLWLLLGILRYVETSIQRFLSDQDSCLCGTRNYEDKTPLIVGGYDVRDTRKYPWLVTVYTLLRPNWGQCAGVIISPRYVLTAAHCFDQMDLDEIQVGIKGKDATRPSNILEVEKIIISPEWSQSSEIITGDVAVLRLEKAIPCSEYNRPICLPDEDLVEVNDDVIIAGWGRMAHDARAEVLQEGTIKIMSTEKCNRISLSKTFNTPVDKENVICAKGLTQTSCTGDSGSPLLVKRGDRFYAIGITSYSFEPPCMPETPVVYMNVARFLPFIEEQAEDLVS